MSVARIDFLEPWSAIDDERRALVKNELERELPDAHLLAGKLLRVVAARIDNDDVLVEVVGSGYAVVHLTWSGRTESDARWPLAELFSTLQEWRERRMQPDHDGYSLG